MFLYTHEQRILFCGVYRQYTVTVGKLTNWQIGVFAVYVSDKGHAFIDRQLVMPKAWTDDRARRAPAPVPSDLILPNPRLATAMFGRASAANAPFAWVAADGVYGVGEIEMALRRAAKG